MEAVLMPSSFQDQSTSPYRQIKNSKRNTRFFVSRHSENMALLTNNNNNIHGSLLFLPQPSLSYSCPPPFSLHNTHQQQLQVQQQQQPPLLPLPINRHHSSLPSPSQSVSWPPPPPPTSKKNSRSRDQSLTPKKSKKPTKIKEESFKVISADSSLIIASTNPSGPDPNDLPKDMLKVLSTSSSSSSIAGDALRNDLEKFSGSVFTISPPPSSLPLPKFSIRPKLSCNAEASGGIDAGATDNLRRLLRL